MKLFVSTDKGLLVYNYVSNAWKLGKIHFLGMPVGATMVDVRNGKWWVALNHKHWGSKLHYSENQGMNWEEVKSPQFPSEYGSTVSSIWTIKPGSDDDPRKFYVGVEPAALFETNDEGKSFELVKGLSEHPTRDSWMGGGKGSTDPFLHTILIDPEDKNHLIVGISCAGVFQSYDKGRNWDPTNEGMEAFFLPQIYAHVGHDPHTLKIASTNHQVIWQQNHCGIYLSQDKGKSWKSVSGQEGVPSYGFALVVDEANENRAWVVPAQGDDNRIPHENALRVYKTEDTGNTWTEQSSGLPGEGAFDLVLRKGMDIRKSHIVFGTNNGNLYHSANYGDNWEIINQNLTTIREVRLVD